MNRARAVKFRTISAISLPFTIYKQFSSLFSALVSFTKWIYPSGRCCFRNVIGRSANKTRWIWMRSFSAAFSIIIPNFFFYLFWFWTLLLLCCFYMCIWVCLRIYFTSSHWNAERNGNANLIWLSESSEALNVFRFDIQLS